jgi:catechol 2,3-dioxygenase-like lactoylglutathione lyase family enzyme
MFDHVSIKVARFSKSFAFYQAALAPLGMVPQFVDEAGKSCGFGPEGSVILWIAEGKPASHVHIAFKREKRAGVGRFHEAALAAGGKNNGAPGPRPDYSDTYYAAFVLDPDGNNIEAVTFSPK